MIELRVSQLDVSLLILFADDFSVGDRGILKLLSIVELGSL